MKPLNQKQIEECKHIAEKYGIDTEYMINWYQMHDRQRTAHKAEWDEVTIRHYTSIKELENAE